MQDGLLLTHNIASLLLVIVIFIIAVNFIGRNKTNDASIIIGSRSEKVCNENEDEKTVKLKLYLHIDDLHYRFMYKPYAMDKNESGDRVEGEWRVSSIERTQLQAIILAETGPIALCLCIYA